MTHLPDLSVVLCAFLHPHDQFKIDQLAELHFPWRAEPKQWVLEEWADLQECFFKGIANSWDAIEHTPPEWRQRPGEKPYIDKLDIDQWVASGKRICVRSLASTFQSKDHIRMNFYELLLLEIQNLISAPLSPSLFFFLSLSLWFSAAYICSQS